MAFKKQMPLPVFRSCVFYYNGLCLIQRHSSHALEWNSDSLEVNGNFTTDFIWAFMPDILSI